MEAVAKELRQIGDAVSRLANTVEGLLGSETVEEEQPNVAKPLTLVEVRTAMPIARSGRSDEIRALLQKHGAESLTALDPAKYAALLKEAKVL
jgi:hypothetical protein